MLRRAFASLCIIVGVGLTALPVAGQNLPKHNLESFEPLDLPAPDAHRAADGRPGAQYWQNEADYRINVTLDAETDRLTGEQLVRYTNNSPDELERLWVQLEQNYFKPNSRGAKVVPSDARFSGFFEGAGYTLSSVKVEHEGETYTPDYSVDGTRLIVPLEEALAAEGGTLDLKIKWSFEIPEFGADRHGILDVEQGTVYQLAQWYPRMYVHDDVNGWNALPYLGQGEYYLEYGTFHVNITAPRDMIVGATGTLLNPEDVLTDKQRERLDEARTSRETIPIIEKSEVGNDDTRPEGEGPLTWRYRAEKVRDFSWAASEAFLWDAAMAKAGQDTVLAQSLYPKEGIGGDKKPGWEKSTEYVQHSVEFYSDFVAPYPYDTAVNVAGTVAGMEYPQIMFCDVESRGRDLFGVTDHEFGHSWFPMVVGTDERRWAWMDEGLNTFMNQYSEDAYYDENNRQSLQRASTLIGQRFAPSPFSDQPIMTHADHVRDRALGFLAYLKPADGLMLLRDYVVGPERFDVAFKAFFDRWAYKHPQPADFFRTIEDVTGEDLDWFWRSWFYETDDVDQAVAEVATGDTTEVTVEQKGELMLPVTVGITYEDESTTQRRIPTEAFFTKDTHAVAVPGGNVTTVQVDPNQLLPDIKRGNNTWTASGSTETGTSSGRQ
ncbi:MAG: peptidase [Bacteroidetes bacterium SW_9_63_38]|nr:MAG: peptidase [Bacteroidetes bacterium SW_9_63_38]